MKHRLCLTLCILSLIVLSACQNKTPLDFSGEGENWTADLTITSIDSKQEERTITLRYKGQDKTAVGEFEFKVSAPNGEWGMGIITLDKDGSFKKTNKVIVSNATRKSDELVLTVKWKGKTEQFPLKNK